ncbi:MAG: methyltransferase domain-containing protein [Deltaproteobacteria bacterium]|nr:methyltransferase domain-containing protein [Deltaproteobacteria bacterium]MBW2414134.1 methyltransferase domain-containing protein [Deltaproteobacteria bacterium]
MTSSAGIKASVQSQFGAASAEYAVAAVHIAGADLDRMLAEADLQPGHRVLDVGSGAGHSTLAFARAGARVTGVDLTAEMVETGRDLARREGLDNADFKQGDAERLPFATDLFDRVTCRLCAHHFADVPAALREMRRVLKPDGLLLLCDSVAPEDDARDAFFQQFETLRDRSHVRNYRVSEWEQMLREAGFSPQTLDRWNLDIDFDAWVERMHTPADRVAALRELAERADPAAREHFLFTGRPGTFLIPICLIRG